MRYVRQLGAISLMAMLSTQELPAAQQTEACQGLPIEVIEGSTDERRQACTAAADALRLLDRCSIVPRRALSIEIKSEVRHPFGGRVLGMFDIHKDRVLVTGVAEIPALIEDTPYATLPWAISTAA